MAFLTKSRNTPQMMSGPRVGAVAAGEVIYQGAMVALNAGGFIVPAGSDGEAVTLGRAKSYADNAQGADGDERVDYEVGVFGYQNSAGADQITPVHIGAVCFATDDQTVSATNGGDTRAPAGIVEAIEGDQVFVRLDAALVRNL